MGSVGAEKGASGRGGRTETWIRGVIVGNPDEHAAGRGLAARRGGYRFRSPPGAELLALPERPDPVTDPRHLPAAEVVLPALLHAGRPHHAHLPADRVP